MSMKGFNVNSYLINRVIESKVGIVICRCMFTLPCSICVFCDILKRKLSCMVWKLYEFGGELLLVSRLTLKVYKAIALGKSGFPRSSLQSSCLLFNTKNIFT